MMNIFSFAPRVASAHARHMVETGIIDNFLGGAGEYFRMLTTRSEGFAALLFSIFIVIACIAYFVQSSFFNKARDRFNKRAQEYYVFIPWMARVSLGFLLIGSGSQGFFLSPLIHASGATALIQSLVGFSILFGFLIGPMAYLTGVFFLAGVAENFGLLSSIEVLALLLIMLIADSRKPGVDDLFGIEDLTNIKTAKKYIPAIARIGAGLSILISVLDLFVLNPRVAGHLIESTGWVYFGINTPVLVIFLGVLQAILAICLIGNIRPRFISIFSFGYIAASFIIFKEDVVFHMSLFVLLFIVMITTDGKLYKKNLPGR